MQDIGVRHDRCRGRSVIAALLAALLALAPFGPSGLAHAGGATSVQSVATPDDALVPPRDPVTSPRAQTSAVLAVLSRLLAGESKHALGPGPAPEVNRGPAGPALVWPGAATSSRHARGVAMRGVDKTAHPSTGPPA